MDSGTLYQLRNLINRRNVRKDPSKDVNTSEDFILTVDEGHILSAVIQVFEMTSLDDVPSSASIPSTARPNLRHMREATFCCMQYKRLLRLMLICLLV